MENNSKKLSIARFTISALYNLAIIIIIFQIVVRIIRFFYKFPIPEFMVDFIDNPIRRRIQPPDRTAVRHGIVPGMRVLEVGPGNGTYTMAAARRVGEKGRLVTVDIEPRNIERVRARAAEEGVPNIDARVANIYALPFDDESFDLVYMIAVMGEIPEPQRALNEFQRVLLPNGRLVFSELLLDPDYQMAPNLIKKVTSSGFRLEELIGNIFYYTTIFTKK